jgi:hypothetical protein
MDIDLLTKEKIIVERFIIHPRFLDNPLESINEQIKTRIEGFRHKQGFVLRLKKIVAMNDLISNRDSLSGEAYIDCTLLVDVLTIVTGNILLGCKIKMITDTGILSTNMNNHISIFIPTDELMDEFQTLYKKGDLIDIEVLGARDVIYDNEIIITAKLLTHKSISRRLFLYNLTDNNSNALDFSGGEELNLLKKLPAKENQRVYEILGYPTGKQLDLYRLITSKKFSQKELNAINPYSLIKFDLNTPIPPLMEIITVFKSLKKNLTKIGGNKILSKIISGVKFTDKNPDLVYYEVSSEFEQMKKLFSKLKESKPSKFIINLEYPIDNLFKADWLYILSSQICKKLWIYRPKCINPLKIENSVFLIGMGIDTNKIPNIGKIGKNATKLFDGELPGDFISVIRTFNELLYGLYLEYGIRLINNPKFVDNPIVEKSKEVLSKEWNDTFSV